MTVVKIEVELRALLRAMDALYKLVSSALCCPAVEELNDHLLYKLINDVTGACATVIFAYEEETDP